jgi:hypothetical protein
MARIERRKKQPTIWENAEITKTKRFPNEHQTNLEPSLFFERMRNNLSSARTAFENRTDEKWSHRQKQNDRTPGNETEKNEVSFNVKRCKTSQSSDLWVLVAIILITITFMN